MPKATVSWAFDPGSFSSIDQSARFVGMINYEIIKRLMPRQYQSNNLKECTSDFHVLIQFPEPPPFPDTSPFKPFYLLTPSFVSLPSTPHLSIPLLFSTSLVFYSHPHAKNHAEGKILIPSSKSFS